MKFNSRKGLLALKELITVILSLIVTFIFLEFIFGFLLSQPSNLEIANQNAQSIKEFVDFSSERFNSQDCFTFLKLNNLENFQIRGDTDDVAKNFYFYLINNKQIKIIDRTYYEKIFEGERVKIEETIDFEDSIILKKDETKEGSFFSVTVYDDFGQAASLIKMGEKIESLVLIPSLDKTIFSSFFGENEEEEVGYKTPFNDIIENNQNVLFAFTYVLGKKEEQKGNFLVFNPNTKELFVTRSQHSNSLFKRNLCSTKEFLNQKHKTNVLFNPDYSDYMNYELTFDAFVSKERVGESFVWNINKIECPGECYKYLGENYNTLSFENFKLKIKEYYNDKYSNYDLKIVNIRKLQNHEKNKKGSELLDKRYDFEFLFYDLFDEEFDYNNVNNKDYIRNRLDSKDEDEVYKGFLEVLEKNGCIRKACEYGLFYKDVAFTYSDEIKKYVGFRHDLLRKDKENNQLYFQGEKIFHIEKNFVEDSFLLGLRNNRNFILAEINIKQKGKRWIVLSQQQFEDIPLLEVDR